VKLSCSITWFTCLTVVLVAAAFGIWAGKRYAVVAATPTVVRGFSTAQSRAALERFKTLEKADLLTAANDFQGARNLIESTMFKPSSDLAIVDGWLRLARLSRREGRFGLATQEMQTCEAEWSKRPELRQRFPIFEVAMWNEQAELAVYGFKNHDLAVKCWDRVAASPWSNADIAAAAANNAVHSAVSAGQFRDAVARVDLIVTSPLTLALPSESLQALLLVRAQKIEELDGLSASLGFYRQLWEAFPNSSNAIVLNAGLRYAFMPQGADLTQSRRALALEVIRRTAAARLAAPATDDVIASGLASVEESVLVLMEKDEVFNGDAQVVQLRTRLKRKSIAAS